MPHHRLVPTLRRALAIALAGGLLAGTALAQGQRSGHAHQHGVASLDLAIDGQSLTIAMEIPLDNLVGFERAPRTAAETARLDAALASLKDGASLFKIDPAAGCSLREVTLTSAALKLGTATAPAGNDGHADLDADYRFECTQAARAGHVELGLFQAFARLQRLEVQAVTGQRQFKRSLRRPATRLNLAP